MMSHDKNRRNGDYRSARPSVNRYRSTDRHQEYYEHQILDVDAQALSSKYLEIYS
jgi:hypothetical protein